MSGPRSPAVHRGARILDAITSGVATTPAALSGVIGLPKSSVADLLSTMEDVSLIGRDRDGGLHAGPRWAELSDPDAVAHRVFRACATTDLDGHTVSLTRVFGNQVVFVDVRPGRHPLPLTPRPGQRASALACAGAVAILSTMTAAEAAEALRSATAHLGLTEEDVARCLAVRLPRRRRVYATHSARVGHQLACAVSGTRLALTLHVPDRWADSAIRKAANALHAAANDD
ncbi:helix-turn-helix domain-containing protein [Mycolicibacterium sp. 050158]|jgi:IclR family transcriptional regulator, blcABC operon repressor|uniref:helix-turn-helix domain-containing protein n=1 Tax=Mycolicibacterium sp. 050158 TaxID=3090602 RepID=UPI00299D456A|nr:helix-turn-helix domain-containing protein [Mycolicibacterium sp. 050158]MDX1888970.1 helix-turn-helix domain-containing protein [Mycolicibacterium sp. 050158]